MTLIVQSPQPVFTEGKVILQKYFERINYSGSTDPSIDTLRALHRAHTLAIPFENLNPLLRLPVKLDIDSLQQKIVQERRGGYCFEQNILFSEVLKQLGFTVRGLAARVMWNIPQGMVPPRAHMILLVTIQNRTYIADTGFGSLTLPEPLLFEEGTVQKTSHENFKIIGDSDEFIIQAEVNGEWKSLYRFGLSEYLLPDYEVMNYYIATHPNSFFPFNLAIARMQKDKRYTIRNKDFTTYTNGTAEKVEIKNVAELKLILDNVFGIALPSVSNLDETLTALFNR